MSYTLTLSDTQGDAMVAGLRKNNAYGDGDVVQVVQEAVSARQLVHHPGVTAVPADFATIVEVPEIES